MSGGIDYSKWDNLSNSDDSSADDNGDEIANPFVSSFQQQSAGNANNAAYLPLASGLSGNESPAEIELLKQGIAYEKEEDTNISWLLVGPLKNICVHPTDKSTSMYSSIIFEEDPNTYKIVEKWGIKPLSEETGGDD